MSLILEALKKLERERQTQERGFLVLGQPSWSAAGERGWTGRAPLLAAAALAGGAIAAVLLWPGRSGEPAGPQAPSTTLAAGPAAPLASEPPLTVSAAPLAAASPAAPRPLVVWRRVQGSSQARPEVQPTVPTAVPPAVPPAVAPTPEPAPAGEALQLQAISERDGAPVAVVSGQMVRVGDRIGTGTVVRIGAAEIEIETDGQRRILKF